MYRDEKPEEPEQPKYRDRAKERREDQNPDYEPTELGSFHAVAPPGNVDLRYLKLLSFLCSEFNGEFVFFFNALMIVGLIFAGWLMHKSFPSRRASTLEVCVSIIVIFRYQICVCTIRYSICTLVFIFRFH